MDTSRLALFNDIAETLNLTLTAERMGYTQSGVSHAIKKLEEEMGVILLRRTNRGVALTRDGEQLLPYIRLVVTRTRLLQEMVDTIHGLQGGSLYIGTYSSVAMHWLPPIIHRYQQLYPGIQIRMREGNANELEQWVDEGSVDFGFLSWRDKQPFKFIYLARDPMYAVTAKNFVLPERCGGVFPMELFKEHLFVTSEMGIDADVQAALKQVQPKNVFFCRGEYTIIHMVESGIGLGFLPCLILKDSEERINMYPTSPPHQRTLGIGVKSEKNLTLAAKAFIAMAREMIGDMIRDAIQ